MPLTSFNGPDGVKGLVREIVNWRVFVGAIGLIALGVLFLWFGLPPRNDSTGTWQLLLTALGGPLLAAGAFSLVWELLARRSFRDEILQHVGLAKDVEMAGLRHVHESFRGPSINWDNLLEGANRLDLFVCWARTWRHTHRERLQHIAQRGQLRVILPDPSDSTVVRILDHHFEDYDCDRVRREIEHAVEFFSGLASTGTGSVEVWHVPRVPFTSWYTLDSVTVFALYAHRGGVTVPSFVVDDDGHLSRFFQREFDFLMTQGKLVSPAGPGDES